MSTLSEKLYSKALEQARKQAQAAKKSLVHTVNGKKYNLQFDSSQWFYEVTDSEGNWILNINSKKPVEAKKFLNYWLSN